MLKKILCVIILSAITLPAFSRTNNEIARQLYANADRMEIQSRAKADKARSDIASFMIDLNMLNFQESRAQWKPLISGYYYDSKSVQNIFSRYLGVYKSADGKMMGIFDINCEDYNDPQERMYGFVNTTDVYFTTTYKTKNGHNKGLAQKFCK